MGNQTLTSQRIIVALLQFTSAVVPTAVWTNSAGFIPSQVRVRNHVFGVFPPTGLV